MFSFGSLASRRATDSIVFQPAARFIYFEDRELFALPSAIEMALSVAWADTRDGCAAISKAFPDLDRHFRSPPRVICVLTSLYDRARTGSVRDYRRECGKFTWSPGALFTGEGGKPCCDEHDSRDSTGQNRVVLEIPSFPAVARNALKQRRKDSTAAAGSTRPHRPSTRSSDPT